MGSRGSRFARRLARRAVPDPAYRALRRRRRPPSPAERRRATLELVTEIEHTESALPATTTAVTMWARDRVLRRPDVPPSIHGLFPTADAGSWRAEPGSFEEVTAPVGADVIVLSKFDLSIRAKLRVAYAQERLLLAAQPLTSRGDGIGRALRAHRVVGAHAPWLIPPLRGAGETASGVPYLIEGWLDGSVLATGGPLAAAAEDLIAGLATVHRGFGVTPVQLTQHWPLLQDRWEETLAMGLIPPDLGQWVRELIDRQGRLRTSFIHGDVVPTNVIKTPEGVALLDWEYAHVGPVMHDAAKLHLFSGDPDGTLELVLKLFGGDVGGPDGYTPPEELALAHARFLGDYSERRQRLTGHPRAGVFERQTKRQVERLRAVREVA